MNARLILAALALTAACGEKPAETAADSSVAVQVGAASLSDVDHAVDIANALSAHPTKGDSILAAHSMTADQLEALMLKIAKDSASSAEYGRRTTR